MLLQREEKALEATVSVEVGMVNVPPFVLSQADYSSTVYVGGGAFCEKPWHVRLPNTTSSSTGDKAAVGGHSSVSPAISRSNQNQASRSAHSSTLFGSPMSIQSSAPIPPTPGPVWSPPSVSLPGMGRAPSRPPIVTTIASRTATRLPANDTLQLERLRNNEDHISRPVFYPTGGIEHGLNQV